MIFFDASAAAKRYFKEAGSERVEELWTGPEFLSSLAILQCELASAVNRKLREHGLTRGTYQTLKEQMRRDLRKLQAVPADADVIEASLRLLDTHPLKVLDSLYLAAALNLHRASSNPVLFVSADRQLLRAALAEGLRVLDPEEV